MSITSHERLIRETAAELITQYRETMPRCPVETHVARGLRERIGMMDAAEERMVEEVIRQAFAPRAWDREGWRAPRSGRPNTRPRCRCGGCLSGLECIDPYNAGGL